MVSIGSKGSKGSGGVGGSGWRTERESCLDEGGRNHEEGGIQGSSPLDPIGPIEPVLSREILKEVVGSLGPNGISQNPMLSCDLSASGLPAPSRAG
jgi:hypothetical protein